MNRSIFGIYNPVHKLALILSDLAFIALSFSLASTWRLDQIPDFLTTEYLGLNLILIASLFIGGAYTSSFIASQPKIPLRTFLTVLSASLPSMLFIYLLGPEKFTALLGRGIFPVAIILFGLLAMLSRIIINKFFQDSNGTRHIVLLGSPTSKERNEVALAEIRENIELSYHEKLEAAAPHASNISAIVIYPDHFPDTAEQSMLIDYRLAGVPIFSLSDFFESFLFRVPVEDINNDWFIRAEGFTMLHSSVVIRIKRATDILLSLILSIVALPILMLVSIPMKLTSRGPLLFSQTRVGMQGRPFTLYKLRTMTLDAEQGGAQWAQSNDQRIIPFGRFLRKTRIDELPQIWNILKGEMSFIGPRPERPEFTNELAKEIPYYDLRHVVKPGLTGWAQVCYPYGASRDDALRKLQFDLYYIKNYSLILDLNILLRTVLVTLRRSGR